MVDFNTDVEKLDLKQIENEISEVDGANAPTWSTKVYDPEKDRYLDRRSKLYDARAKMKGDSDIPLEAQGLHDRLEKAGLKSSEQIEQEAATARGEAVDSIVQGHITSCENTLKTQWGSANYDQNLETARLIFDFVEDEKDISWLQHTPRDGRGTSLANDPKFIELLRQVGQVVLEHNDKFADELKWFNETWKPKKK